MSSLSSSALTSSKQEQDLFTQYAQCGRKQWCVSGAVLIMYPRDMLTKMRDTIPPHETVLVCPACSVAFAKARGNVMCNCCGVWQSTDQFQRRIHTLPGNVCQACLIKRKE